MTTDRRQRLRQVKSFPQLVKYLRDELDWPIDTESFDDLTFDYEPEELGIDAKSAAKIESIKQLRPLVTNQPWGIFFVKFEPKRLPVVAMRRILGRLVFRKRASANKAERPAWDTHDLLFISAFGEGDERQISFAHFSEDSHFGNLATLRVLGWDGDDTGLHIDHVYNELHDKLRWPDHPTDVAHWRARWSLAFTERYREAITTSKDLALELADLARRIRRKVNAALRAESESGKLRTLMRAFQESLIHDIDDDDFADMYAQTIAYGLLSARVARKSGALAADDVALMAPVTSPFLRELMETFLNLGGRKRKSNGQALDFDELGIAEVVEMLRAANMEAVLRDLDNRNPQEDPVVHFYELFLKEYDAKKRMQRGVFYTPKPVVSYIVRSVHELLQTEFGLEDGLADTTTWGEFVDAASSRAAESPSSRATEILSHASPSPGKRQDAASTLVGYFDPDEPIANLSGNLPHWRQEGVTYFVTFRLGDSLPQEKLRQWLAERDAWLKANPQPHTPAQRREYHDLFTERFERWLDQGYGSCVLRRPDVRGAVETALRYFHGTRYVLHEFVVMPNHVHVLVTPLAGHELSQILHSWKSFTANEINRLCATAGMVWQKESFDHIVRSPESFERFRKYIRDNPRLTPSECFASPRTGVFLC